MEPSFLIPSSGYGLRGFEPELGRLLGRPLDGLAAGRLTRGADDGLAAGARAGARGAERTGALRDGADLDGLTDRLDGALGADLMDALLLGADRDGLADRLAVGALLLALRDVEVDLGADTLDDVGTRRAAEALRLVCDLDADLLVVERLVGVARRADDG